MSNKTRDTGNLTANGILSVDLANNRIGVGSTQPQQTVDVNGTIRATENVETNTLRVIGISTLSNVNVSGISTFNSTVYIPNSLYLNGASNTSDLYIGSSNQVKLDHNGSSAFWTNTTGYSYIRGASGLIVQKEGGGYDDIIKGIADGAVELYYDDVKKFETTEAGAVVTGILTATSFSGDGANVTNVDASTLGGDAKTSFMYRIANSDLQMNGQALLLGSYSGSNYSKIRWSGTTNLWDLISGDLLIRDNTTTRFTFARTTGNFTATGNVTGFSDITLKKNIELIPNALDKVLSLRGVTYNRTDIENEPKHSGVIAQEVEEVLPEVVNTNDEGIKSVAYGNMVGLLIEAIKEQQTTIENLTKRIEILEGGN